jgi:hypothetical protein
MSETKFAAQLQALRSRVEPLEKLVHALAGQLPQPLRYHSGNNITDSGTESRMCAIFVC